MRFVQAAAGIFLIVSGIVWTLQGFNSPLAPQSFRTGSAVWIIIGITATFAGALVIRHAWRAHRAARRD